MNKLYLHVIVLTSLVPSFEIFHSFSPEVDEESSIIESMHSRCLQRQYSCFHRLQHVRRIR